MNVLAYYLLDFAFEELKAINVGFISVVGNTDGKVSPNLFIVLAVRNLDGWLVNSTMDFYFKISIYDG